MDEENNVNNNTEEVEGKINKDNEVESNVESDSSNDSSPMSSIDESDYEDNNILKQKLSSTINKNVANQMKLNSHRTQSNSAITHFDDISRKFRHDNNTQNSRIIQEMFKYLTRKPISKSNLFKKLISKKLITIESQKLFESLFREMNTVTHIVNGEKLFSILN